VVSTQSTRVAMKGGEIFFFFFFFLMQQKHVFSRQ
jgi:hypothetical protein